MKHSFEEIVMAPGKIIDGGVLFGWHFHDPCGECTPYYDATTDPPTICGWTYNLAEAERFLNPRMDPT